MRRRLPCRALPDNDVSVELHLPLSFPINNSTSTITYNRFMKLFLVIACANLPQNLKIVKQRRRDFQQTLKSVKQHGSERKGCLSFVEQRCTV